MNRIFTLRWPWLAGGLLVLTSAALLAVWQGRPDSAQAELPQTQALQAADPGVTRSAPVVEKTLLEKNQTPQTRPTITLMVSMNPTSTLPAPGEDPPEQAADQFPQSTSPTATLLCDRAAAGSPVDITVPDETQFLPGQAFTKIWRLQNAGACIWTKDYAARFFFGDRMSAPEIIYLDKEVPPGDEIEIAVDMVAPNLPGSYQGNWKLSNPDGVLFGIGPLSDAPFWVRIEVLRIATPTFTPTETPTATATLTPVVTLTPTSTPTPPVQSSGKVELQAHQKIDLDTGQVEPASGQDVEYDLEDGFHLLEPKSGALLGVYGAQEPGREVCKAATMSSAPIALESLSPGAYLCYQTSQGLPGWLRFDALDSKDGSASLAYLTWILP